MCECVFVCALQFCSMLCCFDSSYRLQICRMCQSLELKSIKSAKWNETKSKATQHTNCLNECVNIRSTFMFCSSVFRFWVTVFVQFLCVQSFFRLIDQFETNFSRWGWRRSTNLFTFETNQKNVETKQKPKILKTNANDGTKKKAGRMTSASCLWDAFTKTNSKKYKNRIVEIHDMKFTVVHVPFGRCLVCRRKISFISTCERTTFKKWILLMRTHYLMLLVILLRCIIYARIYWADADATLLKPKKYLLIWIFTKIWEQKELNKNRRTIWTARNEKWKIKGILNISWFQKRRIYLC